MRLQRLLLGNTLSNKMGIIFPVLVAEQSPNLLLAHKNGTDRYDYNTFPSARTWAVIHCLNKYKLKTIQKRAL